jgi:hypothetical protein
MALVLKQGATWTYKGVSVPIGYAVVDFVSFNKRTRTFVFTLEVYARQNTSGIPENVMRQHQYTIAREDFDQFFSVAKMSTANPFALAYTYLAALRDEENNLVWGDWESDGLV